MFFYRYQQWKEIVKQFFDLWNFPHCIGAMDGKHVNIQPPPNSGSFYYNYKNRFSVALLAVVDAHYKFQYIDIGCNGRVSDGSVFRQSSFFKARENNSLNIPPTEPLLGGSLSVPYVLVRDSAFPFKNYIQKPFNQVGLTYETQIYNYTLSRA